MPWRYLTPMPALAEATVRGGQHSTWMMVEVTSDTIEDPVNQVRAAVTQYNDYRSSTGWEGGPVRIRTMGFTSPSTYRPDLADQLAECDAEDGGVSLIHDSLWFTNERTAIGNLYDDDDMDLVDDDEEDEPVETTSVSVMSRVEQFHRDGLSAPATVRWGDRDTYPYMWMHDAVASWPVTQDQGILPVILCLLPDDQWTWFQTVTEEGTHTLGIINPYRTLAASGFYFFRLSETGLEVVGSEVGMFFSARTMAWHPIGGRVRAAGAQPISVVATFRTSTQVESVLTLALREMPSSSPPPLTADLRRRIDEASQRIAEQRTRGRAEGGWTTVTYASRDNNDPQIIPVSQPAAGSSLWWTPDTEGGS